jgi:hypothetical protein
MKNSSLIARFLTIALPLSVFLALTGCASTNTLQTQVSNFNQWPADSKGASFSVQTVKQAASANWGDLESRTYQNLISDALQKQGLRPAATGEKPRFQAFLRLDQKQEKVERSQPVYAPGWAYPYGMGYRPRGYWHGGVWHDPFLEDGVFGWSAPVYMGERRYEQTITMVLLGLRISDRAQKGDTPQGATVFEGSAEYAGQEAALPALMPYLVQALFSDFPGHNGQVRQISLPIQPPPEAKAAADTPR